MKTLWFLIMVSMWTAFFVLVAVSPGTLLDMWGWVRDLSWPLEVLMWIVFLPWMLALAVWQTDWAAWLRWTLIILFAVGWTVASRPKRKRRKK